MKIGEVYQYLNGDRLQTVRKEWGHYLTYSERVKCVCRLEEVPFRVLKASVEGKTDELSASLARRTRAKPREVHRLIREIGRELQELGLIASLHGTSKRPA